jgi:hypothetical protein
VTLTCPFCEIVIVAPPLVMVIVWPPLVICTFEPFAAHDCVVELTLVFAPFEDDCELCTLTTQVVHDPPLELVETLLLCCCDPLAFVWLTETLTWQPPFGAVDMWLAFALVWFVT